MCVEGTCSGIGTQPDRQLLAKLTRSLLSLSLSTSVMLSFCVIVFLLLARPGAPWVAAHGDDDDDQGPGVAAHGDDDDDQGHHYHHYTDFTDDSDLDEGSDDDLAKHYKGESPSSDFSREPFLSILSREMSVKPSTDRSKLSTRPQAEKEHEHDRLTYTGKEQIPKGNRSGKYNSRQHRLPLGMTIFYTDDDGTDGEGDGSDDYDGLRVNNDAASVVRDVLLDRRVSGHASNVNDYTNASSSGEKTSYTRQGHNENFTIDNSGLSSTGVRPENSLTQSRFGLNRVKAWRANTANTSRFRTNVHSRTRHRDRKRRLNARIFNTAPPSVNSRHFTIHRENVGYFSIPGEHAGLFRALSGNAGNMEGMRVDSLGTVATAEFPGQATGHEHQRTGGEDTCGGGEVRRPSARDHGQENDGEYVTPNGEDYTVSNDYGDSEQYSVGEGDGREGDAYTATSDDGDNSGDSDGVSCVDSDDNGDDNGDDSGDNSGVDSDDDSGVDDNGDDNGVDSGDNSGVDSGDNSGVDYAAGRDSNDDREDEDGCHRNDCSKTDKDSHNKHVDRDLDDDGNGDSDSDDGDSDDGDSEEFRTLTAFILPPLPSLPLDHQTPSLSPPLSSSLALSQPQPPLHPRPQASLHPHQQTRLQSTNLHVSPSQPTLQIFQTLESFCHHAKTDEEGDDGSGDNDRHSSDDDEHFDEFGDNNNIDVLLTVFNKPPNTLLELPNEPLKPPNALVDPPGTLLEPPSAEVGTRASSVAPPGLPVPALEPQTPSAPRLHPSPALGAPRPSSVMTRPPLRSETTLEYMARPDSLYHAPEGVRTHYQFAYTINHQQNQLGHQETRDGDQVSGVYHVLLPGGTRQVVMYYADDTGYHPTVTYEDAYDIDPRSVRDSLQAQSTLAPRSTGPTPNTLQPAAFITPLPSVTQLLVNTVSTEHQNSISENPLLSNLSREARLADEAEVLRQYSPYALYLGGSTDFVFSTNDSIYNSIETTRIPKDPSISIGATLPLTASRNPNTSLKRGQLLIPLQHSHTEHSTIAHLAVTHNTRPSRKNNHIRRNFLLVPVR